MINLSGSPFDNVTRKLLLLKYVRFILFNSRLFTQIETPSQWVILPIGILVYHTSLSDLHFFIGVK